jgi:cytochrome c553
MQSIRVFLLLLCIAATNESQSQVIVPDTMAERTQACTSCHGKEGRATNFGYFPRIAGKPERYLYNQLINFRDARRNQEHMTHLLAPLTNQYLAQMANHFAQLDLPYPAPQAPTTDALQLQLGEQLIRFGDIKRSIPACINCHGQAMTGMHSASPGLLGLSKDYLAAQIGAWKNGSRKAHAPDCMATVANQLTPTDVAALTAWLAHQPVPAKATLEAPRAEALACGSFAKQ